MVYSKADVTNFWDLKFHYVLFISRHASIYKKYIMELFSNKAGIDEDSRVDINSKLTKLSSMVYNNLVLHYLLLYNITDHYISTTLNLPNSAPWSTITL